MRNTVKRATAGAALGGSLFFTAGLAIAFAQPDTANDELVNLSLGSAGTLEDVNVAAAVQIAAAVCGQAAVPQQVTTTADGVDATGTEAVVCTNNTLGAVTISQNGPSQSEEAPGIAGETPTSPTTTTTTTTTTTEEGG
jgi:hypothetical protein